MLMLLTSHGQTTTRARSLFQSSSGYFLTTARAVLGDDPARAMSHRQSQQHDEDDYDAREDESDRAYSDEDHGHDQHDEQKGLTKLLGNPNGASIASNGAAFGKRDDDYSLNGAAASSNGVREGLELEDDDGDEEIEIDSDLEDEIPRPEDDPRAAEIEQPQKCAHWTVLYALGVLMCMACEFIILLPAYYLRLFAIALLYAVVYIIVAFCAIHMLVCPGKRRPHSHLAFALYLAALGAFAGGVGGAYYYKQYWYFDRLNTAYQNVNPHINPYTGVDYSGEFAWTPKPAVQPMITPTFLEFELDLAGTYTDPNNSTAGTKLLPIATYVQRYDAKNGNETVTVGIKTVGSTTYCASAVLSTHHFWNPATGSEPTRPKIFYWAIGEDCCGDRKDGSIDARYTTCPYWGRNVPPEDVIVEFSAEVLDDPENTYYRDAVADFMSQSNYESSLNGADESYLVRVMTLTDHYGNQDSRTKKAWICLLAGAFLWPILYLVYLGGVWLWLQAKAFECCPKDRSRMQ